MTLRLTSTPTKILLTLEEVSPKHQECYEDLMTTLASHKTCDRVVRIYGGVQ